MFLNQSKYVLELIKKYGMETCELADTPMVEKSILDEDQLGKVVDPTRYRGMIGTLMYLTANPNHAGCQDTKKSTCGSMQLLGDRLNRVSTGRHLHQAFSMRTTEISHQKAWNAKHVPGDFKKAGRRRGRVIVQFWTILDICPRVEGVNFTDVPDEDTTLAFPIKLGYKESGLKPEPVKRKTSSKRRVKKKVTLSINDNIIFDDHDTALELGKSISKSKVTSDPPKKLKGVPYLTLEQEAADIMQALKERKKTSKRQPGTKGSSEGTGTIPGVLDESTFLYATSNEDEEMLNAKVEDFDKGDEEVTDAAKTDVEKTSEVKDDAKKTKLLPTSSSLSVSLSFGDQFLKLSIDSSLVCTVKDTTDAKINSLLKVKIQSEVPHIQSSSVLRVPVPVIFEPSVLTPVLESPSIATVTTLPPPSVSKTPFVPQQTTTPIPTPTITTDAPIITTAISESDVLFTIQLRVAKLEKDVFELKKIDLSAEALVSLKTQVTSVIDNYHGSKRKYDDDDEDPPARPNQGKKTRREEPKSQSLPKSHPPARKPLKVKLHLKAPKLVKSVSVKKLHGYGHLEEIVVKRADSQAIPPHLTDSDIVEFIVALRMFTRSLIIKKHVEDLQLGVESYQKKLNITPPQQTFLEIEFKELYTPSHKLPGMRERRIIQNFERLVGAQELEMDYKLMMRTT
nr:uncharacterized mitochondrial protein AtMg00810-like [Tanacetum cinerariifolium]